ncbi:MAG TPA: sugar ABC transporter substrate-binding protein [Gaiellales bacterium]|nr:sugar ABC transporter substrate-binding protein [Gaiellales bacterium]
MAVVAVVAASMLAMTVTASAKPAEQSDTIKLGFITKFPVDFYFLLVNASKKWDKATAGASVIYASGKSGTDDAGEIAAIQNMVAQGVKGIAITPTSPAVSAALDKAIKSGVKVVLMDNDIPSWKKKSSVVATNNFNGGKLAGEYLAKKLKPGDTLGILEGNPANPALVERVTGMLKGLGAMKSKIKVVSKLETDCDQTKGATAAQTILTANQGLTAIYSACGPPALGAIQSIKNAGIKPGGIILVGFDASTDEVKAIKAGTENGSVAQFPAKIGDLGIKTLWAAVQGKKVPKNVDTGTALVTKANASKF